MSDPNLVVGTDTHDDAGVYRLTPELAIVQTLDFFPPVVDDPFIYGQIAAANALSDVYAMGARPLTAMNLVGYPDDKLSLEWLGKILQGGAERCQAAGCTIVGGHTVRDAEIKFGLSVTGIVHPNHVLTNAAAKPGQRLVLTKPLGTGFITTAAKRQICDPDLLARACESMVQLNQIGCQAMLKCGATAATDVTGFGLAGHAHEMADGAKVTIRLHLDRLPIFDGLTPELMAKCRTRAVKSNREYTYHHTRWEARTQESPILDLIYDPQTSGGLLICIDADKVQELRAELLKHGAIVAAEIGEVLPREEGTSLVIA